MSLILLRAKEEVADAFQEYKTATERTMRDKQEELEKLRAETAEMKEQYLYEREQLKFRQ